MSIKVLNLVLFWCYMSGIYGDSNSEAEGNALNETTSDLRRKCILFFESVH